MAATALPGMPPAGQDAGGDRLALWAEATGRRRAAGRGFGGIRFAFYGRVSTEDWQDPVTSRARQRDQAAALVAGYGRIVAEFFDTGYSRTLAWARRPQAAALIAALADPDRGWDEVVIGEYERAFYGGQYVSMAPHDHDAVFGGPGEEQLVAGGDAEEPAGGHGDGDAGPGRNAEEPVGSWAKDDGARVKVIASRSPGCHRTASVIPRFVTRRAGLDRPGSLAGSDSWEDAGSWQHGIRRHSSLQTHRGALVPLPGQSLRSSRYARGLRTCLPRCSCLLLHDHLANPPTWSACLSVLADDGGGPQSASHTSLVIGDDYRSATSLTGWPVTEATVWKSWSSHRTMRPARSAVAAMSRSTGPAERCLPVSVSNCWTSSARS